MESAENGNGVEVAELCEQKGEKEVFFNYDHMDNKSMDEEMSCNGNGACTDDDDDEGEG
jgi:hypothetical protein